MGLGHLNSVPHAAEKVLNQLSHSPAPKKYFLNLSMITDLFINYSSPTRFCVYSFKAVIENKEL